MDLELYQLLLVAAVALFASFIQSVTGFGFGIFAMIFLPYLLSFGEANALSTMLSTLTSLSVMITMLRKISWKKSSQSFAATFRATYLGKYGRDNHALLCSSEYSSYSLNGLNLSFLELGITSCHKNKSIRILPVQLPDYITTFLV